MKALAFKISLTARRVILEEGVPEERVLPEAMSLGLSGEAKKSPEGGDRGRCYVFGHKDR